MIKSYSALSLGTNRNINVSKPTNIKKNLFGELFYLPKITNIFLSRNLNQKNNSLIVNNLLNTSKSLIKNSEKYKSYTTLVKNFHHSYPYKPSKSCFITAKNILNTRNKFEKIILSQPFKILNKKSEINESFFINFIDKFNNNANLIIKYNEYKNKYFIDKFHDGNKQILKDLYENFDIDNKNIKEIFNNDIYNAKKNKFNLRICDIQVCIKLTSLYIYFTDLNKQINSKIKFPFELLSFYYGINFIEFKKFLTAIISFDKNKFHINYNNFQKQFEMFQSLFDFYDGNSFFEEYNNNHQREYFELNWDVETETENKTFNMRIIQPKISISLKCSNNIKYKFFKSIDIKTMGYLLKENFKDWDFIILNYFSQFKVFRKEINKILCGNLNNIEESKDNNLSIKNTKKLFNFNNTHIILNTKNINSSIYHFYYSRIENNDYNNYYFSLFCPGIHITYNNSLNVIKKDFTLDIRRTRQIHKLSFSFDPEDLIRYSLIILKQKENKKERNMGIKLSGLKEGKIRRTGTCLAGNAGFKRRRSIKNTSTRSAKDGKNDTDNDKNNLRKTLRLTTKRKIIENDEKIKDIQLNLDKYIFNFDEDLLKFIKREKKVERKLSDSNNISNNRDSRDKNLNKDRIRIRFSKVRLLIINQNLEESNYYFENEEVENLVKYHPSKWEKYIIENFDEILKQQQNV